MIAVAEKWKSELILASEGRIVFGWMKLMPTTRMLFSSKYD